MLAAWTEILPVFVVRWLSAPASESIKAAWSCAPRAPTYFSKTHHGHDQQYESHGFARAIEHHHGITAAQKGGQHGF